MRNVAFKSWPGYWLLTKILWISSVFPSKYSDSTFQYATTTFPYPFKFSGIIIYKIRLFIFVSIDTVQSKIKKFSTLSLKWSEKDSFTYRDISVSSTLWCCVNTTASGCTRPNSIDKTTGTIVEQIKECMQIKTNLKCSCSFFNYIEKCKAYRINVLKMKYTFNFFYFHLKHPLHQIKSSASDMHRSMQNLHVWCVMSNFNKNWNVVTDLVETPQQQISWISITLFR